MENIYSKVNPDLLLHIVNRFENIVEQRKDLVEGNEFIQAASLNLPLGTTFKPHKHIYKDAPRNLVIAQESWIVLSGKVKCIFYDIDNTLLVEKILNPGDLSITLLGGHNYESLEDGTKVIEYKTGPYLGQQLDKEFI